ncbi:MAG TPA: DUF4912 domain-containing protein [Bacillota bacterium]|nr:DUF4912 domain-containing protein [Bacillota bacterium]
MQAEGLFPYNFKNRIVLLARDPECLFAYWEITPEFWQMVEDYYGVTRAEAKLAAQVIEVNEHSKEYVLITQVELDRLANNWYFYVKGWKGCRVLLGFISEEAGFITLVASNIVRLIDTHPLGKVAPPTASPSTAVTSNSAPAATSTTALPPTAEPPLSLFSTFRS